MSWSSNNDDNSPWGKSSSNNKRKPYNGSGGGNNDDFFDNFQEKPVDKIYINAGIYIISNSVISLMKKNTKIDAPKFLMILKKKRKKV